MQARVQAPGVVVDSLVDVTNKGVTGRVSESVADSMGQRLQDKGWPRQTTIGHRDKSPMHRYLRFQPPQSRKPELPQVAPCGGGGGAEVRDVAGLPNPT